MQSKKKHILKNVSSIMNIFALLPSCSTAFLLKEKNKEKMYVLLGSKAKVFSCHLLEKRHSFS